MQEMFMSLIFVLILLLFLILQEQARLSDAAAKAVKKLLPESANNDLSSKCSWADHVRFIYPWSSALHFADTPDSVCSYNNNSKQQQSYLLSFLSLH